MVPEVTVTTPDAPLPLVLINVTRHVPDPVAVPPELYVAEITLPFGAFSVIGLVPPLLLVLLLIWLIAGGCAARFPRPVFCAKATVAEKQNKTIQISVFIEALISNERHMNVIRRGRARASYRRSVCDISATDVRLYIARQESISRSGCLQT